MAEDEETLKKINSAMKRLSRGDKLKEEMALIVSPNVRWEAFLTPAPMCICLLGELMVISTRNDFPLEHTPPKDGFKLLRWPNSFGASLMQITNSGWRAFNEADKNMDQVRLMTAQVPEYLKDAIKILLQGNDEELEDLLPIILSAIQSIADKCVALASSVEKRFEEVMDLTGEVLESSSTAKGTHKEKLETVEAELAVLKKERDTAEQRKKLSEEQYEKLQRAVEKAVRNYEKSMDLMPSEMPIIRMNAVDGMLNAITAVLSGVRQLTTLGLLEQGEVDKSLGETAASTIFFGEKSHENSPDEKTIDVYTKVPELKAYADSLKMIYIEDKKLKENVPQNEDNIRYLIAQFKQMSQEVGIKGNNNVQNHIIALCNEGMQICMQLRNLSKAMAKEISGIELAQKILKFDEKVSILHLEGIVILGSCPTESKAPCQCMLPQAQGTSKSVAQQAVQNARFKIEASAAQFNCIKDRYGNSCDKLIENTEKIGCLTIAKHDIHKVDFQQIRETLMYVMWAVGEIREQWTKLVRFFQMMSNMIRCSMSSSLADFTAMTEKAKQRKQAIEGYTLSQMKRDLIYKQAFEAAKIAHLVNMISGAYVDVSNRYIMSRVAKLGKLQCYDADSEKDPNAIKEEFDSLVESCKAAQEGIREVVLEQKREFDKRVEMRIKTIKTELNAALPPPLPSDETEASIKEGIKEAMDTIKKVIHTKNMELVAVRAGILRAVGKEIGTNWQDVLESLDLDISMEDETVMEDRIEKSPSPGYKFLQLIGAQKLPGNERITVRQLSDALLESNQVLANDIMLGKIDRRFRSLHQSYSDASIDQRQGAIGGGSVNRDNRVDNQQLNIEPFRSLPADDDQCDIGSEQDGPDDLDDDTHNDNKHKPGAYPDNDLNCHDMENDNQSDTESNDSDTNSGKGEGEKEQIVNELSDTDMNKTTRTRSGIEDKTSNGRCRKRSDEDLSQEESKAKQCLLKLVGLPWDKLVKKAKKYQEFLKKELDIPEILAAHIVSRVYIEGEQSLPPAYEAHVSCPDDNCLYNSVSLILYGDERAAYRLRLAAVCNGAICCKHYVKEFTTNRLNVGSMMQFMQSRLTDQSLRLLDDSKCEDLYYLAEFTIEMAVRETIKPGSYCSPLQVLFLSTAIGYTIHQYFQSGIANLYEVAPTEYHEILPLPVSKRRRDGCVRILWVTQNSRHFNHIVPVIEKVNKEQDQLPDSSSQMIQACRICGETDIPDRTGIQSDQCGDWFHTDCVRLERNKLDIDADWFCPGCSDVVIEKPITQLQAVVRNATTQAQVELFEQEMPTRMKLKHQLDVKEAVQKATKPQAQSTYRDSGEQRPVQTSESGGGFGARTSLRNPELTAQKDRLAAQDGSDTELIPIQHRHIESRSSPEPPIPYGISPVLKPPAQYSPLPCQLSISEMSFSNLSNEHRTFLEDMIKNAIKDAIYVRNREKTIRLLDFACQLQKAQSPDVITDVWPAYREGSTWDPVFVVLSHQTYPEDQYLGFKRHWRHCDLISREGCIVAYSDEVKDNPLSFEDMENMRKLIRAADLLKFHSKVTVTNACPCRSRNGGRDISIEKCIVIYTSVKGFIPFDEQPFPKTVFGIPVDVREANVTLGGKTYKANCEHDSSYRIREPNVLNNSSPVSANNVLTTSLKTFENNTTDNRQMVGKKLRLQRKRKPYTVPKLTRQPDLLQKPMRQQLLETATKISLNSACNSSHGDCKTGYARGDLEYLFPYPEFFQRNPTKAFGNNENPVECSSMETNETNATNGVSNDEVSVERSSLETNEMPETVLKNGHSLKGKNVTLELIKAYRAFGILYSGFNYARMTTDTKSEEMSLAELRKAFTGITGQSPDDYFDIMAIDITETHMRQLLHVTIVKANEFGQPDGHDLRSHPSRETKHADKPNHGRRSNEVNETLLMGTEIGVIDNLNSYCGTLGGFVPLPNGEVGALTCSHVMGIYSGTSGEDLSKLVIQPCVDTCLNDTLLQRYKVGHLYKAVFDNGLRDDVSVDAAVIKIQSRLPNTVEFTNAKRTRIKSAGFETDKPPNFSKGEIMTYEELKRFGGRQVIKFGSETGLTQGVIAMWGTDIRSDNQDMELPNKKEKIGFFNQIEIGSLQYHSSFFDAGDSGSLVFIKYGKGPEVKCIGLAVGWTSYHSCLVTPIEDVFKKIGLPAKFIDDSIV